MNKIVFAAAALLVFTAQAAAFDVPMPPKRFDHFPTEPFEVRYNDPELQRLKCGVAEGYEGYACTFYELRYIIIRNDLSPRLTKLILRHEYGHLNGWSH
jgi:Zn-dependent peptidase ImmA (M78 family)